jgi:GNAT superfamily N-acetyltransferase
MSETVIRRAASDDVRDLATLRYSWRVDELGEQGLDAEEFESQMRGWMNRHRDTHLGYLAAQNDVAVGCGWLCVTDRIPSPSTFVRRAGVLQSIYVRPAQRNVGVGSDLVRLIIEEARAMDLDYLSVHPSEASVTFYRRLGFDDPDRTLELRL